MQRGLVQAVRLVLDTSAGAHSLWDGSCSHLERCGRARLPWCDSLNGKPSWAKRRGDACGPAAAGSEWASYLRSGSPRMGLGRY